MELRTLTEKYLGASILPGEWDKAKEDAERKLRWIIGREGDADGARREPWYMAQLIAEAVRASRLTRFTFEVCETIRLAAAMGAKEKPTA